MISIDRIRAAGLALAAMCGLHAGAAWAGAVVFDDPRLQAPQTIQVNLPGLPATGALPVNYTADGRNISPPLTWSEGPPNTRAYVVVMQDADASGGEAPVHWLVYDVAAGVTGLPRGMKNVAAPSKPLGAAQGGNYHGSLGYSGPRLSQGEGPHHYQLQVFALDRPTRVRPGADLHAVLRAMTGHVLARGELVATYAPPQPKTPHDGPAAASPARSAPG